MKRRFTAIAVAPLAFAAALTYPVWWLLGLPRELRFARLRPRALCAGDLDLEGVAGVRWYTRGVHTIASGREEDHYFELAYANGVRQVVLDTVDGRLHRGLAAAGLLPARAISLGTEAPLAWIAWVFAMAIAAVLYALVAHLAC